MGLSKFLRIGNDEPKVSAFDSVPDDVRQLIANDICAMIECIKCWKGAIQSPEHATALWEEAKLMFRRIGGKMITSAMTGGMDIDKIDLAFIESLNVPMAIIDVIKRVRDSMKPEQCEATDQINHETGQTVRCEMVKGHTGDHCHHLTVDSFVTWGSTNGQAP